MAGPTEANTERRTRFVYGIATSFGSKGTALLLQLLAFPILIQTLGVDRYAVYLALVSLMSWSGLLGLGLGPTLPNAIAGARINGEAEDVRNAILWPLIFVSATAVILEILLLTAPRFVAATALVSAPPDVSGSETGWAYTCVATFACLFLVAMMQPAIRAGHQELHRTNMLSMVSNVVSIGLIIFVAKYLKSIPAFIVALQAPLMVVMFCDMLYFFSGNSKLLHRPTRLRQTAKMLLKPSCNAIAVQAAFFLLAYLPPIVVAHLSTPLATAATGTLLQLTVLGSSFMNLLFQPLLAAIADAHGHNDWHWIKRNYIRGLIIVIANGVVAIAVLGFAGQWIFTHWLQKDIGTSPELFALTGVYFMLMTFSLFHFYVLSGLGHSGRFGATYLILGMFAIILGSLLCTYWQSLGMMLGLSSVLALVMPWYGPLVVYKTLSAK